jgi:signal transduction histidine kinase
MSPTRSEIEKMLAERLQFLIGVGNDMRAPLTGIAGFAAVLSELESVAADPTASEAVAYIGREAQRLVELLNELLDFGQVEQGGPDLDREPTDLVRMARQAVKPWATRHPGLTFQLIEHGRCVVEGDFLKLDRVLGNLLDNAVRHSPEGGTVTIEVGADGSEAFLSVTDQGAGVPEEDRERVFERFVRLTRNGEPTQWTSRGAGIGLYVVRGLVEAHGGSVSVDESRNDGVGSQEEPRAGEAAGARFVVRLPLGGEGEQAEDQEEPAPSTAPVESRSGREN